MPPNGISEDAGAFLALSVSGQAREVIKEEKGITLKAKWLLLSLLLGGQKAFDC